MNKKQHRIIWLIYVGLIPLPMFLYLLFSFYLWFLAGVQTDGDRVTAAAGVFVVGGFFAGAWADLGRVWRP